MLSPVPADSAAPAAVRPTTSDGPASRGSPTGRPSAASACPGSHWPVAGEKYPVPEASPRSVAGSAASAARRPPLRPSRCPPLGPPPASRQVSQSCGSMTRAVLAAASGSCSASQRSLVTVNDAVGTLPVWLAHCSGPPSSEISARACGAERTSFHSRAGLITCPASSTTTMPCCWAATPTASARSSSPSPAVANACHHSSGSHSVPSGCGAVACPTTVPSSARQSITLVDCVDESTPATSIGGSLVEWTTHDNVTRPGRRIQAAFRR